MFIKKIPLSTQTLPGELMNEFRTEAKPFPLCRLYVFRGYYEDNNTVAPLST